MVTLPFREINILNKVFSLMSNKTRLSIIMLLLQTELPVCLISLILNKDQTLISHYLSTLKKEKVISSTKIGKFEFYKINEKIREELNEIFLTAMEIHKKMKKKQNSMSPI